ncbi:MAG: hypothetical protein WAT46_12955 [Saprospiraceae bacterium]
MSWKSNHLIRGNAPTANGGIAAINAANATVKGSKNSPASKIMAVNIPASNGVVHLIDAVQLNILNSVINSKVGPNIDDVSSQSY